MGRIISTATRKKTAPATHPLPAPKPIGALGPTIVPERTILPGDAHIKVSFDPSRNTARISLSEEAAEVIEHNIGKAIGIAMHAYLM